MACNSALRAAPSDRRVSAVIPPGSVTTMFSTASASIASAENRIMRPSCWDGGFGAPALEVVFTNDLPDFPTLCEDPAKVQKLRGSADEPHLQYGFLLLWHPDARCEPTAAGLRRHLRPAVHG